MFDFIIRLLWYKIFNGGTDMLTNTRPGDTKNVINLYLRLGNYQGLFSKASIATGWIDFNAFI